jgi:hypothetical protein
MVNRLPRSFPFPQHGHDHLCLAVGPLGHIDRYAVTKMNEAVRELKILEMTIHGGLAITWYVQSSVCMLCIAEASSSFFCEGVCLLMCLLDQIYLGICKGERSLIARCPMNCSLPHPLR